MTRSVVAKKKILVVEDDVPLREAICLKLSKRGYEVIQATTGEEALALLGKTMPDFVWLDILLPGIDGLEVLKVVRETKSTKDLPVIVVSASCGPEKIKRATEMNICEYAVKSDHKLDSIIGRVASYIK